MAARHRAAARAKFAEGGSVKKGPDFGGVIDEAGKKDAGFKKGGKAKYKEGGIATGIASAPRLDKAPRRAAGGRVPMKRGGSPFTAANSMTKAPEKGKECSNAGDEGEMGKD